ncbi:MAG: TetR family transcriptional regulator C-terminal domain-containing protein [Solirubrobacterales bacterium]
MARERTAVERERAGDEPSTRERILDAACEQIASDGIDGVRIARVAMLAGASTALVHHYFSTREELLAEALAHSFELAADERFGEAPDGQRSATRRLALVIDQCMPRPGPQEREWILWVELWLRAVRDPPLRPVAADLYRRYREWVAEAIAAGIESGEFKACEPDEVADFAMALLDGLGIRALLEDPAMDLERVPRLIAEQLAPRLGLEPEALLLADG